MGCLILNKHSEHGISLPNAELREREGGDAAEGGAVPREAHGREGQDRQTGGAVPDGRLQSPGALALQVRAGGAEGGVQGQPQAARLLHPVQLGRQRRPHAGTDYPG